MADAKKNKKELQAKGNFLFGSKKARKDISLWTKRSKLVEKNLAAESEEEKKKRLENDKRIRELRDKDGLTNKAQRQELELQRRIVKDILPKKTNRKGVRVQQGGGTRTSDESIKKFIRGYSNITGIKTEKPVKAVIKGLNNKTKERVISQASSHQDVDSASIDTQFIGGSSEDNLTGHDAIQDLTKIRTLQDKVGRKKKYIMNDEGHFTVSNDPNFDIDETLKNVKKENDNLNALGAYYAGNPEALNFIKENSNNTDNEQPQSEDMTEYRIPELLKRPEDEEIKKAQQIEQMRKISQAAETMQRAENTSVALATDKGKKVAESLVSRNENLNKFQKNEIKQDIKANPEAPVNSIINNQQKAEVNEKPGVKDSFMEALTFFLPNIVGLAAGGLIGGAEGAVLGEEKGGKLGTGLREYKLKQEELEAKKVKKEDKKKVDITPDFVDVNTNKPVFTRETKSGVEFFDSEGNVVDSSKVRPMQEVLDEKRQAAINKRQANNLDQREIDNILKNKKVFTENRVKDELGNLKSIGDLKALMKSNTSLVGLIDFKMAKGIAGEVGNLATEEREAAAQLIGYKGELSKLQEWITGNISNMRREEIEKLISVIEPNLKKRIKDKASKYASSASRRLKVEPEEYIQELLDDTGFDFGDESQSKSDVSVDKQLEIIRQIKAKRNK